MEQSHDIVALFVLCKLILQTSMRGCAGSPEPSLVAYVISTKIS